MSRVQICATRLRTRRLFHWSPNLPFLRARTSLLGTDHPTIKNPDDALSILDRFSSQYRAPTENEGYDRIIYLQPSEQEIPYSYPSLAAILYRVRDAPSVAPVGPAVFQPSTWGSPYSRGTSFRGTRGRGGGNHVNHTGYRGASNAPTRGMNRWEALPKQSQLRAETPRIQRKSEPAFVPLVGDSGSPSEPNAAAGFPNA